MAPRRSATVGAGTTWPAASSRVGHAGQGCSRRHVPAGRVDGRGEHPKRQPQLLLVQVVEPSSVSTLGPRFAWLSGDRGGASLALAVLVAGHEVEQRLVVGCG